MQGFDDQAAFRVRVTHIRLPGSKAQTDISVTLSGLLSRSAVVGTRLLVSGQLDARPRHSQVTDHGRRHHSQQRLSCPKRSELAALDFAAWFMLAGRFAGPDRPADLSHAELSACLPVMVPVTTAPPLGLRHARWGPAMVTLVRPSAGGRARDRIACRCGPGPRCPPRTSGSACALARDHA
jgi:hypothetical protein